jgi:hypothetical protein
LLLTAFCVGTPDVAEAHTWHTHGCHGGVRAPGPTAGGQFGVIGNGSKNGIFTPVFPKETRAPCARHRNQILTIRMLVWGYSSNDGWRHVRTVSIGRWTLPPGYHVSQVASEVFEAIYLNVSVLYKFVWKTAGGRWLGNVTLDHNEVSDYSCPQYCSVHADDVVGAYIHYPLP